MNVEHLKEGNLIKVYPEGHQEGLLFIKEIQASSYICEMIIPRPGYLFRIKPSEMTPIPLSADWLTKAGFSVSQDELWSGKVGCANFRWKDPEGKFDGPDSPVVRYVHEFQNEYRHLTGENVAFSI